MSITDTVGKFTDCVVTLQSVAFVRMLVAVIENDDQELFHLHPKGGRASFHITNEGQEFLLDSALTGEGFPESGVEDMLSKALASTGAELALEPADLEQIIHQMAAMGRSKCSTRSQTARSSITARRCSFAAASILTSAMSCFEMILLWKVSWRWRASLASRRIVKKH